MHPTIKKITRKTRSTLKKIHRYLFVKKISPSQLRSQIVKLGIEAGDTLFVHSALSQLGYVDGGPKAVIEVLLDILGDNGTLAMPGFIINKSMLNTLSSYQDSDKIFDVNDKAGGSGLIAKIFVQEYASHISIHPTHAVAAIGKNAAYLTQGHEDCDSNFGVGTPLYKLIELDAKIMGLGSSIANVTFYHVLEDVTKDFPIKMYEDTIFDVRVKRADNSITTMHIKAHTHNIPSRIERQTGKAVREYFWKTFSNNKTLLSRKVGKSISWFIKANDLFNNISNLLDEGITIYSTKDEIDHLTKK